MRIIEPCVTLKEEHQGKSFVNRASFVPIEMEGMNFVDKTIQAGVSKFWDYFEGNPMRIAPNVAVTVHDKDCRFACSTSKSCVDSAGTVTFDISGSITLFFNFVLQGRI